MTDPIAELIDRHGPRIAALHDRLRPLYRDGDNAKALVAIGEAFDELVAETQRALAYVVLAAGGEVVVTPGLLEEGPDIELTSAELAGDHPNRRGLRFQARRREG